MLLHKKNDSRNASVKSEMLLKPPPDFALPLWQAPQYRQAIHDLLKAAIWGLGPRETIRRHPRDRALESVFLG
jgi:hypothetical protein